MPGAAAPAGAAPSSTGDSDILELEHVIG
jgi:WD40 repeat protein